MDIPAHESFRRFVRPFGGDGSLTFYFTQSIDRRRFPFRRYSIDEDGSLVCRTRNISREAYVCYLCLALAWGAESYLNRRSRPYDAARDPPPRSRTPVFSQPHASSSEPTAATQTLNSIIPAIMRNPEAFRESIPTVCAEHNIDPTVLESLVQNLRSAQPTSNPPKDL